MRHHQLNLSRFSFFVLLVVASNAVSGCTENEEKQTKTRGAAFAEPQYVGRSTCISCHQEEVDAWTGSHHDLAMQEATDSTVLGDFDTATFFYNGILTTFFKRDGAFFVNTDGPTGQLDDYKVAYVFGVLPLQQVLIAFPGGRLQALGIAWDSRPKSEGGQRWFHLYPDIHVDENNPLHWTGPNQTWNFMCADCHSTDLQKNYDVESNRYDTKWSEIDVSCESCHGPASGHLAWAETTGLADTDSELGAEEVYPAKGLTVRLPQRDAGFRVMNSETGIARLEGRTSSDVLVNTCAPCHSRRSDIARNVHPGGNLLSSHRPSLLRDGLYYADGQILDEVYVYGSFVQSKMYAAGVVCSDCHDSHSLKMRATGNALCASCHAPDKFDTPAHTFHDSGSEASQCVTCHMPQTTYMVVDPRRDHRFGVPRPDLSDQINTPNACTSCHSDKSASWASDAVARWYGTSRRERMDFGEAFAASFEGHPDASKLLIRVATESSYPGIARATALSLLEPHASEATAAAVTPALSDPNPIVRLGALQAMALFPPAEMLSRAYPLLSDSILAVRLEAVRILSRLPRDVVSLDQRNAIENRAEEYIEAERVQDDRPESWMNIALMQSRLGRFEEAEFSYQRAMNLNPLEGAIYVNLADLYRSQGSEDRSEALLRQALELIPNEPAVNYALGLSLVRQQRLQEALPRLKIAAEVEPVNVRFEYVYAVALNSAGNSEEAVSVLKRALQTHPYDTDLLMAMATFLRQADRYAEALDYALRLQELNPDDIGAHNLVVELRSALQ